MTREWPEPYTKIFSPWGLFRGEEIVWIGMALDEEAAWKVGLGWPSSEEIAEAKAKGVYAARFEVRQL